VNIFVDIHSALNKGYVCTAFFNIVIYDMYCLIFKQSVIGITSIENIKINIKSKSHLNSQYRLYNI